MKAKLSTLARRLEELEMRNQHEVRAVVEGLVHIQPCFIFQSTDHQGEHCPTTPSMRDLMDEHANVVGQYKPSTNAQYNNTYNPNWRNHHNLSWSQNLQCMSSLVHNSSNNVAPHLNHNHRHPHLQLSKVVGNFVEQKTINVQLTQKINTVESTLNSRIDGF